MIEGGAESAASSVKRSVALIHFCAAPNVRQVIEPRSIDLSRLAMAVERAASHCTRRCPSTTARGASPCRLSKPVLNANWWVPSWASVFTFL